MKYASVCSYMGENKYFQSQTDLTLKKSLQCFEVLKEFTVQSGDKAK